MEKDFNHPQETPSDELIDALKLIRDVMVGGELIAFKEFVTAMDESRQDDLANMERRIQSSQTKNREDLAAIVADLQAIRAELETDRKKWYEELECIRDQMQKTGTDLSSKIDTTMAMLRQDATQLDDQIQADVAELKQNHAEWTSAVEDRIARCEGESNARKEESGRLASLLSDAAQSLVTTTTENPSIPDASTEQLHQLLTEPSDVASSSTKETATCSRDATENQNVSEADRSENEGLVEIESVLEKLVR